ncbi:MAG: radical SAM protein [Clostridia bacterium]|nr:radical SAM protein [Clostridia bacterium]
MRTHNIPVFVPHLGCDHVCAFCNQRSITGSAGDMTASRARAVIEEHLRTIHGGRTMVAFFGGSFTGIEETRQCELLALAKGYLDRGDICGIRLSTRPDYIDAAVIERLNFYGVTNVEIGAQSMCDEVLAASGRGHDANTVRRAAHSVREAGLTLGLQMMLNLPLDNDEKAVYTAREFIALGASETRIYPTLVVRKTELCRRYERGEYKPQSVEEAVELSAKLLEMFHNGGVRVLRIGLLGGASLKENLVAGPYHDAFGELVYSRLCRRAMEKALKRDGYIKINCPRRFISKAVGQKKCNIEYFKKMGVEVEINPTEGEFAINQSITIQED